MSHFKFVSTINAAEEGCTHFLVLGNRRLRLGHTRGWGRASAWNHHPFCSRRARSSVRGVLSHTSKGFQPQRDRDRLGHEEGERGCSGEAPGTKRCHLGCHPEGDAQGTARGPGAGGTQGAPCSLRSFPPRGCACHRYIGPMFKCLQKVKL